MDLLDRLLGQVTTLEALWPSFVVVCVLATLFVWRVMEWRYRAVIEGLDHRIKLKDDTIAQLDRGLPNAPVQAPAPSRRVREPRQPVIELDDDPRTVRVAPENRVYIQNKTIIDLMCMLDGNTQMKEEALARRYLNKWIRITLPVRNVVRRDDEMLVMFARPDFYLSQIWLHFPGERERIEILEEGDTLTAVGRITELSSVGARLYGCETVKAA